MYWAYFCCMNDISGRSDIELLVNTFYDKVKQDDTIGFIFHEIIGEDWSHHLPIMYSFWETVLMGKAGYTGNPIRKHTDLDKRIPLEDQHYERWQSLWNQTVDELFAGPIADDAKYKAGNMVNLINIKVKMSRDKKNIM